MRRRIESQAVFEWALNDYTEMQTAVRGLRVIYKRKLRPITALLK